MHLVTRRRAAPQSTPQGPRETSRGKADRTGTVDRDPGSAQTQLVCPMTCPVRADRRAGGWLSADVPGKYRPAWGTRVTPGQRRHNQGVRETCQVSETHRRVRETFHVTADTQRNSGDITEQENTDGKEGLSSGPSNRVRGTRETTSFVTVKRHAPRGLTSQGGFTDGMRETAQAAADPPEG